jgi:hypothetical protein
VQDTHAFPGQMLACICTPLWIILQTQWPTVAGSAEYGTHMAMRIAIVQQPLQHSSTVQHSRKLVKI